MESETPYGTSDFVMDIQGKPPITRQKILTESAYAKPKSRIVEPSYPKSSILAEESHQTPRARSFDVNSPRTSAPATPRTNLTEQEDDDDSDDEVYTTENLNLDKEVKPGKKVQIMVMIEWVAFICIMGVLVTSLTVKKLESYRIWSLELWKWCVLVSVIFCGSLFTEWLTNILVLLIEKNFLLKKKVLYFLFSLKKSVRFVIWLALILLAWCLLINRGVKCSDETIHVLKYITRGIISTLVAAVLWMIKTLIIKLIASSFHVRTYFDRIQESIFHQYILQTLSRPKMVNSGEINPKVPGRLSFKHVTAGKKKEKRKAEVINVDRLYKMKRDKVSAWTMGGLIKVIRDSELPTISEVLDESFDEESGETKVITSEIEARDAANRIFRNVAKHGHKYIEEDDLLQFMPKEEVDNVLPLFEGAAESRQIKKSSFRNWVVKSYNERKYLAVSLNDAKTAVEELNKIGSVIILIVITIVILLVMGIATTKLLVFVSSQLLLVAFMFGNTVKMVFEAIIFVFIMHPFDVGDRCVVDGIEMVVDEMNILTTIFLKGDNEKIYYPNSALAAKRISNFNRSPEMGDSVLFAVDFSTPFEKIASMKAKIKMYLESKPQHWSPDHSVQILEILDVNKMMMGLFVTHTINFQSGERGDRRSDLIFQLKKIFEEIGIEYRPLPREVQVSYAHGLTWGKS